MAWHFKIMYSPKQSIVFDSSKVEQFKGGFQDQARANSYGYLTIDQNKWDRDYHLVSTIEEKELIPDERHKRFISQIDTHYNDIEVYNTVGGTLERRYNESLLLSGIAQHEIEFLRQWYPHFTFKWDHQMFYNVIFNKPKDWGLQRLPCI